MPLTGYRKPATGIPVSDLGPTAAPAAFGYLTTGHETIPRWAGSAAQSMTSGVTRISYFTARASTAATSIRVSCGTQAGATPTLVKFGLYSVDASTGDLTQIAVTANDTALLASPATEYTKAFSSPTTVTAGSRYAVAGLVVTAASLPTIFGVSGATAAAMGQAPRIAAALTSQSDLQSSYVAGVLVNTNTVLYAVVVP